jgi:hypothetical protein
MAPFPMLNTCPMIESSIGSAAALTPPPGHLSTRAAPSTLLLHRTKCPNHNSRVVVFPTYNNLISPFQISTRVSKLLQKHVGENVKSVTKSGGDQEAPLFNSYAFDNQEQVSYPAVTNYHEHVQPTPTSKSLASDRCRTWTRVER